MFGLVIDQLSKVYAQCEVLTSLAITKSKNRAHKTLLPFEGNFQEVTVTWSTVCNFFI